jgi:2-isopropylmalate synthase
VISGVNRAYARADEVVQATFFAGQPAVQAVA